MKKETGKALSTVVLMIAATLCAKALGMLRQMATASIFAAGVEGIAFSAASKIPFAIFDMLFSTAILGSFLPIYRGHLGSDETRARLFSSSFFTFTMLLTSAAALIGVVFAEPLVTLSAPNLDAETRVLAVALLRIMFPATVFAGMAYTLIGVMQSHEKFLLPAMISAVSNIILLLYLSFCGKISDKTAAIYGLALAYLVSWAAQFVTLMVPLLRSRHMPRLSLHFRDPDLLLAEKRALPVMFGAWLIPMTTLTANAFSSYIDSSSIEQGAEQGAAIVVFETAFSLFSIAGGLMTYGICNYLFPKLAAKFTGGDTEGFGASARLGLGVSLAVTVPIAAGVYFLSEEIIRLLYLRGNFTEGLALASAVSLKMLALALPAYGMMEFLSRAAYSCGKVLYPMAGALAGILTGFSVSLLFALSDALTVGTVALSAVLGLCVAAFLQMMLMRRLLAVSFDREFWKKFAVWMGGFGVSAGSMYFARYFLKKILQKTDAFLNFVIIAIVFILGFVVYLIWIFLFRHLIFSNRYTERRTLLNE